MQQRTYPHGVPCWIDAEQDDLEAARRFYGGLFGWTFEDMLPPGGDDRYLVARLDGKDVAALASPGPWSRGPGWNTYVAVDDVDVTAAAVTRAGGTVRHGPERIGPPGALADCDDPQGAAFRLWQPGRRVGAQRVNEPGTWNFSHLGTGDPGPAVTFYGAVFGWVPQTSDDGWGFLRVPGYGDHLAATVDPGIHERQASAPAGFADAVAGLEPLDGGGTARWRVLFAVADRDAAEDAVQRLGGAVTASGEDGWTRWAQVTDPQGATLTLSQFAPPDGLEG